MEEKKLDKRICNTNRTLRENLFLLLSEKNADQITPTELCRKAGINRNTFYAHYNSAREMLEEVENELFAQIFDAAGDALLNGSSLSFFRAVCVSLEQQSQTAEILLGEHGDEAFLERLFKMAEGYFVSEWERRGVQPSPEKTKLCFAYCSRGGATLLRQWALDGMKMPPDSAAELIERFYRACLKEIEA